MTDEKKIIEVSKRRPLVFDLFVNRMNGWWPKEDTWSGETLVDIGIDVHVDGDTILTGRFRSILSLENNTE